MVSKLHSVDRWQGRKSLRLFMLLRRLRGWIRDDPVDWRSDTVRTFMRDKLLTLDPDKRQLCYMLCRALGARRIVEVGTSFGVSTIYLAAVRDNFCRDGQGIVIGTELEQSKAAAARICLAEAGDDGIRLTTSAAACSPPSPKTPVPAAFLQNTLEQSVITIFTLLALVLLLSATALPLIAASVFLFGIGRVPFLAGYPHGAGARSFGMAVTALPSLLASVLAAVSVTERLVA